MVAKSKLLNFLPTAVYFIISAAAYINMILALDSINLFILSYLNPYLFPSFFLWSGWEGYKNTQLLLCLPSLVRFKSTNSTSEQLGPDNETPIHTYVREAMIGLLLGDGTLVLLKNIKEEELILNSSRIGS